MPLHILKSLPREVRDKIWINVLESSTGYIMLRRNNLEHREEFRIFPVFEVYSPSSKEVSILVCGIIRLSFLRTCKQIYEETKGMFWRHNTLVLMPGEYILGSKTLDFNQIMHVRFDVELRELWERSDLKRTEKTLRMFGVWARDGNLRTISLNPTPGLMNILGVVDLRRFGEPHILPHNGSLNANGGKKVFKEYLAIFRKASGEKGYLAELDRRVVINTGWQHFTPEGQVSAIRSGNPISDFQGLLDTLKDLHDAFGGELWQDGTLCHKDHTEIARPFNLKEG
jgi:hypothetical protein